MAKSPATTEQRILEAAKRVFHRKGFEGASMQEIADEAGINKALLHYYYRNKENLFNGVFLEAFQALFQRIFTVLGSDISMEEKIRMIFSTYIGMLQENSYIPWFILNSLHREPEKIAEMMTSSGIAPDDIFRKLKKSMKKEKIKDPDYRQLIINIISLSVFPIVGKPLIKLVFNFSEAEFDRFIEARKKELPEFVINAIRKK